MINLAVVNLFNPWDGVGLWIHSRPQVDDGVTLALRKARLNDLVIVSESTEEVVQHPRVPSFVKSGDQLQPERNAHQLDKVLVCARQEFLKNGIGIRGLFQRGEHPIARISAIPYPVSVAFISSPLIQAEENPDMGRRTYARTKCG